MLERRKHSSDVSKVFKYLHLSLALTGVCWEFFLLARQVLHLNYRRQRKTVEQNGGQAALGGGLLHDVVNRKCYQQSMTIVISTRLQVRLSSGDCIIGKFSSVLLRTSNEKERLASPVFLIFRVQARPSKMTSWPCLVGKRAEASLTVTWSALLWCERSARPVFSLRPPGDASLVDPGHREQSLPKFWCSYLFCLVCGLTIQVQVVVNVFGIDARNFRLLYLEMKDPDVHCPSLEGEFDHFDAHETNRRNVEVWVGFPYCDSKYGKCSENFVLLAHLHDPKIPNPPPPLPEGGTQDPPWETLPSHFHREPVPSSGRSQGREAFRA